MTREIKFRAWDDVNKRYIKNPFIAFDEYGHDAYEDHREWEDAIRRNCVLEQFTSFKDRHGKEIYDGDILEFDAKEWGDDRTNKFSVTCSESDGAWQGCGTPSEWKYFCTVIGNIHENGDLLK